VAASTVAAELLFRLTESPRLSMVFLAAVLLSAYVLGSGPAYFAAGVAFLVYNFYLVEPRFTFSFESEDLVTLVVFLAVAMLTGNLTGRVRDQAARAEARARATDALFRATREFSALSEEHVIRERLARHLAAGARGDAFVIEPGALAVSGGGDLSAEILEAARAYAGGDAAIPDGWAFHLLGAADLPLGVAGWRPGADQALSRDEVTLLEILAGAGAAALARARLAAAKTEAETRARTEDLRNALLSSVSHDLRTPLAAILASASSLQEFGESFAPEVRRDLAATIQEEAERLDAFVANLLNMTRVEAGALIVRPSPFDVAEVVARTVDRRARSLRRKACVDAPRDLPEALGDPVLFEQALGNVIENAMRHTPAQATVEVRAWRAGGEVLVEVADSGDGVAPADLGRIFEKFFRGGAGAGQPGAGLGLSITRGLMEGMGGGVGARNRDAPDRGLAVTLRLPAAPR
jgi:two-component system sensor histidine kinase KdpD